MKNKNIFLYLSLAILLIFTIGYFITVNKVSYAFAYNEEQELYNSKINLITKCALIYGEQNPDLFKEKDSIYITVNDLVEAGLIEADDEDGNVKNPMSDVKVLNDLKIRLTFKNDKVNVKILDE